MNRFTAPFCKIDAALASPHLSKWTKQASQWSKFFLFVLLLLSSFIIVILSRSFSYSHALVVLSFAIFFCFANYRFYRRLNPLSKITSACENAMALVEHFPACATYRDEVLAKDRELLAVDLETLRKIALDLEEQGAKVAYGTGADIASSKRLQREKIAFISLYSVIGIGYIAFMITIISPPASVVYAPLWMIVTCAMVAGAMGVTEFQSIWRMPIKWDEADELLDDPRTSAYLKNVLRQGLAIRVYHLRLATEAAEHAEEKTKNSIACHNLHNISGSI